MRSRAFVAVVAIVALVASGPMVAWADGTTAPAAPAATSGTSTGTVTMTAIPDQGAASAAPASSASAPPSGSAAPASTGPAPGSEATGFGWSTPKKHKGGHASVAHRSASGAAVASDGPGAVVPGFEMLGDGSTRLFVQMPKAVIYTEKAAAGTLTYVLKDISVDKRNNYNPLVTVHFNTPVTSARLVPHGRDLWLVVKLRAKVQPTAAMQAAKDGGSVLQLDFPKGDYLPAASAAASDGSDSAAAPSHGRSSHP
jgi:hypothetical protein